MTIDCEFELDDWVWCIDPQKKEMVKGFITEFIVTRKWIVARVIYLDASGAIHSHLTEVDRLKKAE